MNGKALRRSAAEAASRVSASETSDGCLVHDDSRLRHQVNRPLAGQDRYSPPFHGLHDHVQDGTLQGHLKGADSFLIHVLHLQSIPLFQSLFGPPSSRMQRVTIPVACTNSEWHAPYEGGPGKVPGQAGDPKRTEIFTRISLLAFILTFLSQECSNPPPGRIATRERLQSGVSIGPMLRPVSKVIPYAKTAWA